jgi:hypothetical protein
MESTTLNPATYFLASKNQIYERITLQKHHLGSFVAFLEKKKKKIPALSQPSITINYNPKSPAYKFHKPCKYLNTNQECGQNAVM